MASFLEAFQIISERAGDFFRLGDCAVVWRDCDLGMTPEAALWWQGLNREHICHNMAQPLFFQRTLNSILCQKVTPPNIDEHRTTGRAGSKNITVQQPPCVWRRGEYSH